MKQEPTPAQKAARRQAVTEVLLRTLALITTAALAVATAAGLRGVLPAAPATVAVVLFALLAALTSYLSDELHRYRAWRDTKRRLSRLWD